MPAQWLQTILMSANKPDHADRSVTFLNGAFHLFEAFEAVPADLGHQFVR